MRALLLALLPALSAARELDPGACAARFDVQRDKIIRTEESRAMGARYLAELDVGARAECRRLCCETDACGVFVYEEKSPGSCYLFDCGPPEDFRCKFTAHSNFSSGVLALSRRLAELQDQERAPPAPPATHAAHATHGSSAAPPAAAPPRAPPVPPPVSPPASPPAPPLPTSSGRCSRYQFECRAGGECVAVYNACDGVPQCADGSDEAPELGCPAAAAPPTAPRAELRESAELPGAGAGPARGAAAPAGARWPHRLAQAQPAASPGRYSESAAEAEAAPHIFSHAGGLVQSAPAPRAPYAPQYADFEPPAPAAPPAWRRAWPPPPPPGVEGAGGGAWGPAWGRAWPVPPQEMPYSAPGNTQPEAAPPYAAREHTLRDAPKKGLGLERAPPAPTAAHAPVPAPAPPHNATRAEPARDTVAPSAAAAGVAAGAAAAHSAAAAASAEQLAEGEGRSEHPPAAVLLLVLGVSMAGALAGMAACRARAARRRRGRAPLAHDADYLVNGMYL